MMKLIDLYFDSTSVIFASRGKRSGAHLVLSGGSLVSWGIYYPVCFTLSDKKNVLFSPCCKNSHPLCNCLYFPTVRRLERIRSTRTEKTSRDTAPCGGTQPHVEGHHNSFTPQSIWAAKGAEYPHSLFFTGPKIRI